jgi:cell wall-associated NlpC family hydrolase
MNNPRLMTGAGSPNQANLFSNMNNFSQLTGTGAAGAAQFATSLTSPGALAMIQLYGGGTQGALISPDGTIHGSQQTFQALMKAFSQGRTWSPGQLKALALDDQAWARINANWGQGTNANFTMTEINAVRQWAAAGGDVNKAKQAVSRTPAITGQKKTTAETRAKTSAFQATVPTQNLANQAATNAYNAGANAIDQNPGMANFMLGVTKAGTAALSLAGHLAILDAAIKVLTGSSVISKLLGLGRGKIPGISRVPKTSLPGTGTGEIPEVAVGAAEAGGTGAAAAVGAGVAAVAGLTALSLWSDVHNAAAENKTGMFGGGINKGALKAVTKAPLPTVSKNLSPTLLNALQKYYNPDGTLKSGTPMGDPTGETSTAGLDPAMRRRMTAMMAANPNLKIASGKRSAAQQAFLYAAKGGKGVAPPGQSAHQTGKAVDVGPPSQFGWVAKNASRFGLGRPAPQSEPWHLQAMGDPTANTVTGAQVVAGAQADIGTPYVWGGTTPGQGLDCSGLVVAVYSKLGISVPRTSQAQASFGTAVASLAQAQPGDLIIYNEQGEGPNSHVAIYIGNGQQIAAPYTGKTVEVESVDTPNISTIRRIVGGGAGAAAAKAAQGAVGTPSTDSAKHSSGGAAAVANINNNFLANVKGSWLQGGAMTGPGPSSSTTAAAPSSSVTAAAGSSGSGSGANLSTTPTQPGGMSASAVYQLALGAGLSPKAAQIATAVAQVESGFNPQAVDHDANGTTDYGLWQINSVHGVSTDMFNPTAAAAEMAKLTSNGQNWGPWAPDFGASNYGGNPAIGGKVAAAMQSLGFMGDPFTGGGMMGGGAGAMSGGGRRSTGGGGITLNMPLQVVSASQSEAQRLVHMVMQELNKQTGLSIVSTT